MAKTDWESIIDAAVPPEKIIETLADAMLHADNYTKGEAVVPDYRTRLQAAQTLLLHRRGKPSEAPEPKPDKEGGTRSVTDLSDDALNGIMATLAAEQKRRAGKDPL